MGDSPAGNRLGSSASLYLRQHAGDPVHWQPWDDQAFALASTMDRPILLSVGYSACHWCHVMARESFADAATAALMNGLFVCIKVDREERPDLDRFFLATLAAWGKAAGWPMTVFLRPDGSPFDGGGYFPPTPRFGLPAFGDVLRSMAGARAAPASLTPASQRGRGVDDHIPPPLLNRIARELAAGIDPLYGGFGMDGPKFPHAMGHELLLRAWDRTGDSRLRETAAASVAAMANGAIFDQIGGGYHRYAVDDRWRVPHFEKMLNDNALMIRLGTQLWQATQGSLFASRTRGTIDWLLREMTLPCGAFAASMAAESPARDGSGAAEGAFYLWSEAELHESLGPGAGAFFERFQLVTDPRLAGEHSLVRCAADHDWTYDGACEDDLLRLRAVRDRRPRPLRDNKCLADWNGLAIAALARAGMAFGRPEWISAAQAAFGAVRARLAEGVDMAHCVAGSAGTVPGLLDDYAAMADAALALHEATGSLSYLDHALGWVKVLDDRFWDADGGYFLTAAGAERRIPRQKLIDETASPAGNGMMLGVQARLYALTGSDHFRQRFVGILEAFAGTMSRARLQAATALCHSQALDQFVTVIVAGEGVPARALRQVADAHYLADGLVIQANRVAVWPVGHPACGKGAVAGAAAAYVCVGQSCLPPVLSPEALAAAMSAPARRMD